MTFCLAGLWSTMVHACLEIGILFIDFLLWRNIQLSGALLLSGSHDDLKLPAQIRG